MTTNPAQLRLATLGISERTDGERPARRNPAAAAVVDACGDDSDVRVEDAPIADQTMLVDAFRRHHVALHRYLMVRTRGNSTLCDDLMQQTFMAGLKGAIGVPQSQVEHWFRGVAKRMLVSHIRRQGVRAERLAHNNADLAAQLAEELAAPRDGESSANGAGRIISAERGEQLMLALTELDGDLQDLLIRHYFRGQSQASIAGAAGTSTRAIEGRLYRARQALRERLCSMRHDWLTTDDGG